MTRLRLFRNRLIARFLGCFREVRTMREIQANFQETVRKSGQDALNARRERDAAVAKLADVERGLSIMTDARMNSDRSHEFLKGELDAIKEAHAREVDGLKHMIDALAPSSIGRTVYGLSPAQPVLSEERMQPQGAQTARTMRAAAIAEFYAQAAARQAARAGGLDPNPDGNAPPDFSVKQ